MSLVFFKSKTSNDFFLAKAQSPLTNDALDKLAELLNAQVCAAESKAALFITARAGTVSPWSSKASDIAAQIGLTGLRLEKVASFTEADLSKAGFDALTQSAFASLAQCVEIFNEPAAASLQTFDCVGLGIAALEAADQTLGSALSADELAWLNAHFQSEARNPTDAELMMFAQANSEHCRHKIFNANYVVNGEASTLSLFGEIRTTHKNQPLGTVLAYADNAAILGEASVSSFAANPNSLVYESRSQTIHHVLKAETHNHPTAVAPFPGAATGAGGEIRDEGATGRGARPVAGLSAYSLSHLHFPTLTQAHEAKSAALSKPPHLASSLTILKDAPLGAAAFNNEFGRPNLGGSLRVFEGRANNQAYGFHKPIMLAAGWGIIAQQHSSKEKVKSGDYLIQLGGPGYLIGFGGGAASSRSLSSDNAALDFASVQRDNAEMERRVQMVLNHCIALGDANPIASIHDVGAGGLSNALPEIVAADNLGAAIDLDAIPLGSGGLSPAQIWSNESQERYVLAVKPEMYAQLEALCLRERCPVAVLGVATELPRFIVTSKASRTPIVDWTMDKLLGSLPQMQRTVSAYLADAQAVQLMPSAQTLRDVLAHPSVASKRYLLHIGDRSVGGLTHQDSFVGERQVPVADCVITLNDFAGLSGAAASMGERSPVAVSNAPASGRLSVAEAVMNVWAAPVASLKDVKLSCNWMANCADPAQDAALRATVDATTAFCRAMDIAVPVGKDSLSMQAKWTDKASQQMQQVQSPVSLTVTAYAPLASVAGAVTPLLQKRSDTQLILIKAHAASRLGGSIAQQVLAQTVGGETPDITPQGLRGLLSLLDELKQSGRLLAYHDVSDGGAWAALAEMAFTQHYGLTIDCSALATVAAFNFLLAEEIGAVIQIESQHLASLLSTAQSLGLDARALAAPDFEKNEVSIKTADGAAFSASITSLLQDWDAVAFEMSRLRDNAALAAQENEFVISGKPVVWANPKPTQLAAPAVLKTKPRVAVLREQGVNSHSEMAWAYAQAGFEAIDVHMTDLQTGRVKLADCQALVACGGFSYGDVLGAGTGWARSILFNENLAEQFSRFFANENTLSLGVCNGCQMISQLGELMPNAPILPRFVKNASNRFEARLSMVEVLANNAVMLQGLAGAQLPIIVSHGEGRVASLDGIAAQGVMRFVNQDGSAASSYPLNPNGSSQGLTAFTTVQGRVLMMMPHPERIYRQAQTVLPGADLSRNTAWQQLFTNAANFFA